MKKLLILILIFSSCNVTKHLNVIGGSKADAVVEMAYEYSWPNKASLSWDGAEEKAINTCIEWGYRSAKRFESPKRDCINQGEKGCLSWRVTWQYQCIE